MSVTNFVYTFTGREISCEIEITQSVNSLIISSLRQPRTNLSNRASPSSLGSLIACSADINVSHGSVATRARCGGSFNIHLTTNLPVNFLIGSDFYRIPVTSLWPHFLAHPVHPSSNVIPGYVLAPVWWQ